MKILIPIDRSSRDGVVLPYSVKAAKAYEASLVLLTVLPFHRSFLPSAKREAEAYLAATAAGLEDLDIEVEHYVRKGDVASVIVGFIEETQCDMIVMASRARGSLGKLVLGSVADSVLSSCGKPVLLLSEAATSAETDETVRQQSAYLAAVMWNRKARGQMTADEVRHQIDVLAVRGLDKTVLTSTYEALEEEGGVPFGWLDIEFQLDTLKSFLPAEMPGRTLQPPLPGASGQEAA